ncbi:MAG: Rhs element Vgr protein [Alphaproteobacteria bacterium]|nr:Rhs element Vgr protein [Alphaproteobacteria bacterium]
MSARPLTDGEIALAKTVFGDAIDYSTVEVKDSKFVGFHPEGTAMAPDGTLYMYGCYHDDYSQLDPEGQSLFIHEMTHVWQFQNKVLYPIVEAVKLNFRHNFNYSASYGYALDEKKDLLDYNMEQQASIVQDYFVLKTAGRASHWTSCTDHHDDAETKRLYESVLKNFIADPGYARKAAKQARPALARKKRPKPPKPPSN